MGRWSGAVLSLAGRIWAYSGLALFVCFLLYCTYGGVFAFSLLLMSFGGLLYRAQDHFLFYPELPTHSRVFVPVPSMHGLPYENVHARSPDGTMLHMFFVPQPDGTRRCVPTFLFLHGNAGNMGHRLQNCVGIYRSLRCNVLLVEYRGYGLSEGAPFEEGLYADARTALDYLYSRNDIDSSQIVLFGRSLGGAVAIDLASRPGYADRIWCLIVENTFTAIPDMAKVLIGWKIFNYLPLLCYKNKFLSIHKIKQVRTPTLFVSGLADTLVPPRMMSELHECCGSEVKQLLQMPSGTHNETWTLHGYYRSIAVFLHNCRNCKPQKQTHSTVPVDNWAAAIQEV